jgi:uncharacterized protein YneF (UPF0154 family)
MKTTMAILLAIFFLLIGILVIIGYFMIEWIVPYLKEHLP